MNDTMQGSAQLSPAVRDVPGRYDAEKALAAADSDGRHFFSHAVALPVPHASLLLEQGRWREADAALLASFLELTGLVLPPDRVFRWTGTSLVVLIGRRDTEAALCQQLEQLPAEAGLFPLEAESDLAGLTRQIDLSVAADCRFQASANFRTKLSNRGR